MQRSSRSLRGAPTGDTAVTPADALQVLRRPLGLGLTVRRQQDILAVVGELDLATGPRLDRVLRWLESGGRTLWLDLRDLDFVDCAGWRVVVDAVARRTRSDTPPLRVADMSRRVRRFVALYEECGPRA